MPANRLTLFIIAGLLLGIFAGLFAHLYVENTSSFVDSMSLITTIFLRLIKMIIAPLIFATLVVGIAKIGDITAVGRVGGKAMLWFIAASIVSLTLGAVMVNLLQPGQSLAGTLPAAGENAGLATSALSLQEFIAHVVPSSIVDGMARNEILQIVVFSVFFGTAAAAIGEKASGVLDVLESVGFVMLRLTNYVMLFAPFAVFAAVSAAIARSGIDIVSTYALFMLEFYISMLLLWVILIAAGAMVLKRRIWRLIRAIREPLLLAFSTASSEAAYPKTLAQLEKFGCSNRVASFVLPLGYSFNLDGSMLYCSFATLFIAQAYGIDIPVATQVLMLLVLMVTSKGIAGVPRASLVVIAATLVQFGIPEEGILLLLAVDHFLDMGRSATNVVGNSLASAVVAKWEGSLHPERSEDEMPFAGREHGDGVAVLSEVPDQS